MAKHSNKYHKKKGAKATKQTFSDIGKSIDKQFEEQEKRFNKKLKEIDKGFE